jgi:hypothetical protein
VRARGPSRRVVLVAAAAGAASLGFAGIAAWPSRLRAPRTTLRVLDANTFSTMAAVADRVCTGTSSGGLPSAWDLEVPEKVDEALWGMHPGTAADVLGALKLLETGLFGAVDGRIRPFTRLSPAGQDRVLERWRTSRIGIRRSAFTALASLAAAAYWSHPSTFAHVGYPGPPRFAAPEAEP